MAKRRPYIKLDEDLVVPHILDGLDEAQSERSGWLSNRLARLSKLRGWKSEGARTDFEWSDQHIPVMLASSLRVKAGLHNAILGIRPVMQAKPLQRVHAQAAERVANLIDHQLFLESDGERRIETYIDQFVDDGTVFTFVPWVREKAKMVDVRTIQRPDVPLPEAMPQLLPTLIAGLSKLTQERSDGYAWSAELPSRNPTEPPSLVEIALWDDPDSDQLKIEFRWSPTVTDGPQMVVQALEDVVAPMRSENLQPITTANPFGSPWVCRLIRIDLETLLRRIDDGTYDRLDDMDVESLRSYLGPRIPKEPTQTDEDSLKAHKESLAGFETSWGLEQNQRWLTLVEWYGRWDVDDDGIEEDVIVWVLKEPKRLARVSYLTELYPGMPPQRPFGEARYVPVPQMLYGMGLPELMEGLHDFIHVVMNQTIDYGTITNAPFFFYRASSGLKPDVIRLWPGEGYPLDMPQQDVHFPSFPQRDQAWGLNMIGMGIQFLDRLTQIGPLQQGQVPTGKASALRTVGTTMAILHQGAAMPEQILRRCFHGLRQVWEHFHVLNTRFLPRHKEYLLAGKAPDAEDAYGVIEKPDEIAVPLAFDFQATLLNTNKGVMAQALQALGQMLISPLALQMGLVDKERIYNWAADLIQANQLDPARYIIKPPGTPEGPRMLWEEALQLILNGQLPAVAPLEPVQEHYQKALAFMQTDDFGLVQGESLVLFREYLKSLLMAVRQAVQAQQMAQAAQQFNQMLQQGSQPAGGAGGMGAEPPMQPEMPTQQEINQ